MEWGETEENDCMGTGGEAKMKTDYCARRKRRLEGRKEKKDTVIMK